MPTKKGWLDTLIKVAPLLVATIAFIGLLFTIHSFIHDREKENGGANLTNIPFEKHSFFSSLASKDRVKDDGGTVHGGAFQPGGECGSGFVSRKIKEVITFPIGSFTNMQAGTVELCVTLKQELVDGKDYDLFRVGDDDGAVILQISSNDKDEENQFHNVRLRLRPGDRAGMKKNVRVLTSKIDWQPEEHHHIAATWGAAGMYIYIDGVQDIAERWQEASKNNVAKGRENLDKPFVINSNHHNPLDAIAPTNCVVSNLGIHNYQKSHAEVKESYDALHPNE